MNQEVVIMAGEVLTKSLLSKVDKAAYQYGGFKTIGGVKTKSGFNMDAKTTVGISAKHIKCDIEKFMQAFSKTMNAWYFELKVTA